MHTPMAQAAHRPRVHCAVSWHALGRIVAPFLAMSRLCLAVYLHGPARWRAVSQPFWPYRVPPAPYSGACSAVSQRCCAPCRSLSHDTPSSLAALLSRYKNCIVTQLRLNQDMRALPLVATQNLCHDAKPHAARARSCRACGLVVSQPSCAVSWPYHGRARPYRGRILPGHARLLRALCHDTVCCIVTQHKL